MSEAIERYDCADCGATVENTDGSVTVFAQKNGWALTRRFDEQKRMLLEWHCPVCRMKSVNQQKLQPKL